MITSSLLVRPPRLADSLSLSLQGWVREGRLGPGDQLPTEKQLADQFGVSRAVVREAIARLKADGYVETRQGSGAFVAPHAGRANFRIREPGIAASAASLREVFELRCVVEAGIAEMAAARRTAADLAAIGAPLARMSAALGCGAEASRDDDVFHRAIAAATHNPLVERFMEFIGAQVQESRQPTWSAEGHAAGRARDAQAEHVAIYEAVRAGDQEAARRAAAGHLRAAARRLGVDFDRDAASGPALDRTSEE